jgi:hypothetical protein
MRSVGIVTIIDHRNFGNRLQNYALQEVVRDMGFNVVTLRNSPRQGDGAPALKRRVETLRRRGVHAFLDRSRNTLRVPRPTEFEDPRILSRIRENRDFTSALIRESGASFEDLSDPSILAKAFDFFIAGSDQVWNPHFRLLNQIDFLTFANEGQRVAYAASIGVSALSRYESRRYGHYLRGIPSVSVREYEAADIVFRLTGRRVPVVLDPTMLLDLQQWHRVSTSPPRLQDNDYIVKFHLGELESSRCGIVEEFAKKRRWQVVDLNDVGDERAFCSSPTDFLGAIRDAQMVVTDSFHAAVFATLFRTPYVVEGGGTMNSRFDTLSRHSEIRTGGWRTPADLEACLGVEWDSVHARLAKERELSMRFLATSLGQVAE